MTDDFDRRLTGDLDRRLKPDLDRRLRDNLLGCPNDDLDRCLRTERNLDRRHDRDLERRLGDLDSERDLRRIERERERDCLPLFSGDFELLRFCVSLRCERDSLELFDRDLRLSEDVDRLLHLEDSDSITLD